MNKIFLNETEVIEELTTVVSMIKKGLLFGTVILPLVMFSLYYTEAVSLVIFLVTSLFSIVAHPFQVKTIEKALGQRKSIIGIEKLTDDKYQFTFISNILTEPKKETFELNNKEFEILKFNQKQSNLKDKDGVTYSLSSELVAFLENRSEAKPNLDRKSVFEEIK